MKTKFLNKALIAAVLAGGFFSSGAMATLLNTGTFNVSAAVGAQCSFDTTTNPLADLDWNGYIFGVGEDFVVSGHKYSEKETAQVNCTVGLPHVKLMALYQGYDAKPIRHLSIDNSGLSPFFLYKLRAIAGTGTPSAYWGDTPDNSGGDPSLIVPMFGGGGSYVGLFSYDAELQGTNAPTTAGYYRQTVTVNIVFP
jgi:hypothetical protein